MTTIEIILLIIGFVCLCVSFFVSKKNSDQLANSEKESQSSELWTEKEEERIKKRVDEILSERQNEWMDSAEDKMNRLCNDKIMAVDEFSQQLLEKIDANHQEVVFMYNMLSEKEKELKEMASKPAPKPVVRSESVEEIGTQTAISRLTANTHATQKRETGKKEEPKKTIKKETKITQSSSSGQNDINEQIKKMHQQGKTILEISKALNIGQGEVKLILALYGGRK